MIKEKKVSDFKPLIVMGAFVGIVVLITSLIYKSWLISSISLVVAIGGLFAYFYFKAILAKADRIRKMEAAFPDFLQLMSSNLRAGMTVSKAILLSGREEFAPLDKEILRVGNDITTGKDISIALLDMSKRIESEKINKTILLMISGIKSGGNMSVLIEETASNIRGRDFVQKRAASNVLMYVIFIFAAVAVAAPVLFSLSNVLVEIMGNILQNLPDTSGTGGKVPFTLSAVSVSPTFIMYFSIIFMLMIDVLASLVIGLVSVGDEKEGLKYILPIVAIGFSTFFLVRVFLSKFLAGLF